jgi:hypothetical protein
MKGDDTPEMAAQFAKDFGISFPFVVEADSFYALNWPPGVQSPFPRDVLLDKKGVVRMLKASYNADEIEALVETLLLEP